MSEIEQKVADLVVQICGTDEVLEDRDLDLVDAGMIDSMGFVELLFGLEQELGIQVSPTEVERDELATVNKIIQFASEWI